MAFAWEWLSGMDLVYATAALATRCLGPLALSLLFCYVVCLALDAMDNNRRQLLRGREAVRRETEQVHDLGASLGQNIQRVQQGLACLREVLSALDEARLGLDKIRLELATQCPSAGGADGCAVCQPGRVQGQHEDEGELSD